MPIPTSKVLLCRCYTTKNKKGQHRRVLGISNGNVTYESWGGGVGYRPGSLSRQTVSIERFAADVDREINCPTTLPPCP